MLSDICTILLSFTRISTIHSAVSLLRPVYTMPVPVKTVKNACVLAYPAMSMHVPLRVFY